MAGFEVKGQPFLDLPPVEDVPTTIRFAGPGYVPKLDKERFRGHCRAVLVVFRRWPGRWLTYHHLAVMSGVPEGSVRTRV